MPNKRKEGKKLVSFWASEDEKEALQEAAIENGFETLTEYLKWIASDPPRIENDVVEGEHD